MGRRRRSELVGGEAACRPRTESPPAGYHMNSPVTLKNANLTILGGPSTFYLGESVIVEQSTVIFDKVDFIGTGASDAIVVLGEGSHDSSARLQL